MSDQQDPNAPGTIGPQGEFVPDVSKLDIAAVEANAFKQPAGLWVLFITEMWERFSYYGMRALLVLYLIASTNEQINKDGSLVDNVNPGFGWDKDNAYILYGLYTWAVYLTPIMGGWLADRFLGTHRSMLLGGWIIAAGHIVLAMTELSGITAGEVVTMQTSPGALITFVTGLLLIVIGTGFFKPCVSVMVGQLYGKDDARRDSGFTIFYMGINLGAFLAPLVAGTLGQKIGWHWGFGSAAVGMILGLIFYQIFRPKYLGNIGLSPKQEASKFAGREPTAAEQKQLDDDAHEAKRTFTLVDWQRLGVIFILAFIGNIFFWTAFEQAGTSLTVFAEENTNRPMPLPEWFRSFCTDVDYGQWYLAVGIGVIALIPLVAWFAVRTLRNRLTTFFSWAVAGLGVEAITLGLWKFFKIGRAHV